MPDEETLGPIICPAGCIDEYDCADIVGGDCAREVGLTTEPCS